MDSSTGKPAPCVCSKMFTGLQLLIFLFIYLRSSKEKNKKPLLKPISASQMLRAGYGVLLFLETFSPNDPKPGCFPGKTENSMNGEKKRWHLSQAQVLFVRSAKITSARFAAGGNKPGLLNLEHLDQGSVPPKQSCLQGLGRSSSELLEQCTPTFWVCTSKCPIYQGMSSPE